MRMIKLVVLFLYDKGYNYYAAKQDKSALVKMFNFVACDSKQYQLASDKKLS